QAGSVTAPSSASTPHGTSESAMNAACRAGRSAAKEAANFSRSRKRYPFCGGRMGGTGAPGGGSAMSVLTDSPFVGGERGDVHQRRDLRVVAGLGDDRAAVGVADQYHRPVLGVDDLPGGFNVAGQ